MDESSTQEMSNFFYETAHLFTGAGVAMDTLTSCLVVSDWFINKCPGRTCKAARCVEVTQNSGLKHNEFNDNE